MYTPDMMAALKDYTDVIDRKLIEYLPEANDGQKSVVRAMKYSLANGGKRLRPVFTLEFCRVCSGEIKSALPLACALEYVHTYSLIHDDLPCMDNDDMRRGNPSCHKMYGESTALLAGDALLTHAFELITNADLPDDRIVKAVSLLSQNSGVGGMIGGQVIDLIFESQRPELSELLTVYKLKTGALISAACLMGCIAAGADDEKMAAASKFAYYLGIAFQIKDDLLDIYGDEEKLGKPVGSDAENEKFTYVSAVGAEKARQDVERLTENAIAQLDAFEDTGFLETLARYLVNREK